jgi:probable F420-dependent oxidoreductase
MRLGVVFPQTEFNGDAAAIRDYAQTAESLGFSHIVAYDHVLGANPDRPGGWHGPYTYQSPFHEVFVLLSYMAALTKSIEFATAVLILPQRQTALVARQAATLDYLSGGRFRLGVGLGWNEVEYSALNENFHTRGKRIEEQVDLLRKLFTQELVNFTGKWHTIPDAGINPLPIQRPIPIWFGGSAEAALKRIAKIADGWMCTQRTPELARPVHDLLVKYLEEAGRSIGSFGIEARILYGDGQPDSWLSAIEQWIEMGATHISFNTMGSGFNSPAQHIDAVQKMAKAVTGKFW